MTDPAPDFLHFTPLRALLGIPNEYLDQAMGLAYQLYRAGRYADAEVMCQGLLAVDHRYWWSYALYAATLMKLGRNAEALRQLECGLRHEPRQPKLLTMRGEILAAAAQQEAA